jgi:hypothetical protein
MAGHSKLTSRRLTTKQAPPDRARLLRDAVAAKAHALECADDTLPTLGQRVRRHHVHYTHTRTNNSSHRQPASFTREEFWKHIEKCYLLAYPKPDSLTGSILMFGCVAKERHARAWGIQHRDEHHHCPVFCSEQHYWEKVVRISREKFGVYLNAVEHTGYTEMWRYLKEPSQKKPLAELDGDMYISPLHPRGEDLAKLLDAGTRSRSCRRGDSSCLADGHRSGRGKRQRVESVFEVIKNHNIRSVGDLESLANTEASGGRAAIAELYTRCGHKFPRMIENARRVIDAPLLAKERSMSLMDKLRRAATEQPCVCAGTWGPGAVQVLQRNCINKHVFATAIVRAFELGAKRGVNVGLVGKAGSGKSMLIEPLEKVFKAVGKPQKNSSFPLANIGDCDLLLWQDYKHHEPTVSFTDLLSVLVGESVEVRLPGERNEKVRNVAPMLYSGRAPLSSSFHDLGERAEYDEMMMERFTTFFFTNPIPKAVRRADHPHCGKCCAEFYGSNAS